MERKTEEEKQCSWDVTDVEVRVLCVFSGRGAAWPPEAPRQPQQPADGVLVCPREGGSY